MVFQRPPFSLDSRRRTGGDVARIIDARVYLDVMERRFTDAFQTVEKEVANDDHEHLQQLAGRVALRVLAGQPGQPNPPEKKRCRYSRPDSESDQMTLSYDRAILGLPRSRAQCRCSARCQTGGGFNSIEKDSLAGPNFQNGLAQIEARAGAPEEAIRRLRRLLSIPAGQVASIAPLD